MDPFVCEHINDGYARITRGVCFFSCVIRNLSPNILLDSRKSFFVHLHYFKTSAAWGFKLCIRVPRICSEISKLISHLNNAVGNSVEACSFMRVHIAALKCLKPNSFTTALLCCSLPNCIFAIYISLRDSTVQLSQGTQCRRFRPSNFQRRSVLSSCGPPAAVAETVWTICEDALSIPPHIPSLGDGAGCALVPLQSTRRLCDPRPYDSPSLCLLAYRCPDKPPPPPTLAPLLVFGGNPLSIYSLLSLTRRISLAAPPGKLPASPEPLARVLLVPPQSRQREPKRN